MRNIEREKYTIKRARDNAKVKEEEKEKYAKIKRNRARKIIFFVHSR